ncbi:MAG: hypothetical protein AAGA03_09495 [Planctomycetota bacterium]
MIRTDGQPWTLEQLARVQATLERRVAARDPQNIHAIGFGPIKRSRASDPAFAAHFLVHHKRQRVSKAKAIQPTESVRLRSRATGGFLRVEVITKVRESGSPVCTGVSVASVSGQATTSAVVRWATLDPPPKLPRDEDPNDPNWRWGVLTVSHLFVSDRSGGVGRVERVATCGQGPEEVQGRVVARGRIPGGPDVALVETGLDRLWLSGFLPRPSRSQVPTADEGDLLRWTQEGAQGEVLGDGTIGQWTFQLLHPELKIDRLGTLKNVIRVESGNAPDKGEEPFAPGTSGSVMTSSGRAAGLQVAAIRPDYRIGFVQAFETSLPWLRTKLKATAFAVVQLVSEG